MLHQKKRTLGISYYFLLLMCCWIANTNVANGQESQNVDSVPEASEIEGEFNFEVGSIESLTAETITVNGQQFLISIDTRFTDSEGTPIYETDQIAEGVEVAVSFYPYEETAIAVELLPDKSDEMPIRKQTSPKIKKRKKQSVVLKNGVYRN